LPAVESTHSSQDVTLAEPASSPRVIQRRPRQRQDTIAQPWQRPLASAIKISVVMPVYNEEATVIQAIRGLLTTRYPCEIELIVVNDGSTDRTASLLAQLSSERLIIREHQANCGKGAALRHAMAEASGTHVLPFDADLEDSPEDIPNLVDPVIRGRSAVVYGARHRGFNTSYHSYRYALGNRILTCVANLLFDANITDLHTCLKLIPRSLLDELDLHESGFGLDTEITALLLKHGIRPFEVPISYFSRSRAQGKKINWHDALVCLRILLRVRVSGQRYRISNANGYRTPSRDIPVQLSEATDHLGDIANHADGAQCPATESAVGFAASAGGWS
jgi:glycosyltransferase involved in cell wall biosynthesis